MMKNVNKGERPWMDLLELDSNIEQWVICN